MPAKKGSKAGATITLKHLAAGIAAAHDMPKKTSEALLNSAIEHVVAQLKKGKRVRLGGLGVFVVRQRAARMGRNPRTGEPLKIKAAKKVAFRGTRDWP